MIVGITGILAGLFTRLGERAAGSQVLGVILLFAGIVAVIVSGVLVILGRDP